jgi:hypothetical protein
VSLVLLVGFIWFVVMLPLGMALGRAVRTAERRDDRTPHAGTTQADATAA